MEEVWRSVLEYEGLYEVSNLGRVRSLPRYSCKQRIKGRMLKPSGWPYLHVTLHRDGSYKNAMVHRLVAQAFLPNPDNLSEVDHIDHNRFNNSVDNLRWVDATTNTAAKLAHNTKTSYRRAVKCLETSEVFASISAAGKFVSTDATRIIESIATSSCCKGYTFAYLDSLPEDEQHYMQQAHMKYQDFHRRPDMPNSRKVRCIESEEIFDSIAAAARAYNCDTGTIVNRIEAKKPFSGVTLEYIN